MKRSSLGETGLGVLCVCVLVEVVGAGQRGPRGLLELMVGLVYFP